jgi:hypothetical protein
VAHTSGTGESNSVPPESKSGQVTVPTHPIGRRSVGVGLVMPSTVELPISSPAPADVPGRAYAWVTGIEPATSGFGDRRSDLLSYTHMDLIEVNKNRPVPGSGRAACGLVLRYPVARMFSFGS